MLNRPPATPFTYGRKPRNVPTSPSRSRAMASVSAISTRAMPRPYAMKADNPLRKLSDVNVDATSDRKIGIVHDSDEIAYDTPKTNIVGSSRDPVPRSSFGSRRI